MYFSHPGEPTAATIAQLQNMLRIAARQISTLARDKQQLIEMGNRLQTTAERWGVPIMFNSLAQLNTAKKFQYVINLLYRYVHTTS